MMKHHVKIVETSIAAETRSRSISPTDSARKLVIAEPVIAPKPTLPPIRRG